MQIKSWQIALVGVIIQSFVVGSMLLSALLSPKIDSLGRGDYALGIAALSALLFLIILGGVILTLLLYFNRTRKLGAIISIILALYLTITIIVDTHVTISNGSYSVTILSFSLGNILLYPFLFIIAILENIVNSITTQGIILFAFLLAGIYYFWKKI